MDINKTPVSLRGILSNNIGSNNIHDTNNNKFVEDLNYDGEVGDIYKIWIKNFFLNILTLGVYQFWGKTSLRNYIVGSYELAKHRFEYRGTAGELFKGYIKLSAYTITLFIYSFFYSNTTFFNWNKAYVLSTCNNAFPICFFCNI